MCLWVQWVGSTEAATSRRHNALLRCLALTVDMAHSCLKQIYPVLFAFMLRPMLPLHVPGYAPRIRLEQVYLQEVLDHLHTSVIVSAVYRLLLVFLSVKPFSFICSIDVWSMYFMQIINKCVANVSPCKTPVIMSKSMSPFGERTISFVFFIEHHYSSNSCFGEAKYEKYLPHFPAMYRIKYHGKIYKQVLPRDFFARTPSMIQRIIRICEVVDLFPRKQVLIFP